MKNGSNDNHLLKFPKIAKAKEGGPDGRFWPPRPKPGGAPRICRVLEGLLEFAFVVSGLQISVQGGLKGRDF